MSVDDDTSGVASFFLLIDGSDGIFDSQLGFSIDVEHAGQVIFF